ncbi:aldehyde dehydrogenase [Rhodococcus tibetensis]|uniref:Aldehyde dehydrogenase n=1 Tax=Rhodococcus tibetensis TaxID=2965064 RepID=A0ABT1QIS2_9NOCA|nr:aldehyde dehydrogenase [Rhodococcus sp. FXJ9.536]MCQ4122092.1 aldehyde dehydrogenase [Rhodococcus sp. FXJ9.536]
MGLDRPHLFINGEFVTGTDTLVDVVDPSTGKVLGAAATAGLADIDAAVTAANTALPGWSATPAHERADVLDRFAAALAARGQDTATLCSQENGMPITLSASANGLAPAALLGIYAGLARELTWVQWRPSLTGTTELLRVPVGVVAAISPWNYPQTLAMMKIAPALAAGCTVVFKAALETALDAFVFADAAVEAGLPAGVLNIVPAGLEASQHLVAHPDIDKVAFTGSTPAGRAIGEVCGRLLRPVTLELGGKSAGIVLDDVDLDVLARGLYGASFPNNGMTCYASTRLLVPANRYTEVVDTVTSVVKSFTVGDPLDHGTLIGPMVTALHQQRVLNYIETGKSSSARLTTGGGAVTGLDGYFVAPTVFADVDNGDTIAREEIFGPVLSIIKYDDDAQAVRIANDSEFGLGGTVWSTDADRADAIAHQVKTGTVGINSYTLDLGSPFGGVKASGHGRELGPEGIEPYLTYQSVYKTPAVIG